MLQALSLPPDSDGTVAIQFDFVHPLETVGQFRYCKTIHWLNAAYLLEIEHLKPVQAFCVPKNPGFALPVSD